MIQRPRVSTDSLKASLGKGFNHPGLWWMLLLLVVGLSYGNVFSNQFVYDDEFLIQKNAFLRSTEGLVSIWSHSSTAGAGLTDNFYRPLQSSCYWLITQFFGLNEDAFHLLNIALHYLVAVAVWHFLMRLKVPPVLAGSLGVFWVVHPVHTEAVTYMSATADPLHTLFILLSLLAVWPRNHGGVSQPTSSFQAVLGLVFLLGALLSKEAAVVTCALWSATAVLFPDRGHQRLQLLRSGPAWVLTGLYLVFRREVLDLQNGFSGFDPANPLVTSWTARIATFLGTLPEYGRVIVWPQRLSIDSPTEIYTTFTAEPVLAGIGLLALFLLVCGICAYQLKQSAWLANTAAGSSQWSVDAFIFCFLFVLIAHSPHSGIVLPMNALFLEHWVYLPSVGLVGMVGVVGAAFARPWTGGSVKTLVGGIALLSLLGGWMMRTRAQNQVWESAFTLYPHILEENPTVARVLNNLAMAHADRGEDAKALELYDRSLTQAQTYPQTFHNRALVLMRMGRYPEARQGFQQALRLNPAFHFSRPYLEKLDCLEKGQCR